MKQFDFNPNKKALNEVAIANFGSFQIVVSTTTKMVARKLLSVEILTTERDYHNCGYLICDRQIIADISGLEISLINTENSPFRPLQRLAPAIDLAFEVKSLWPLPQSILSQAIFACQLPNNSWRYRTVFRQIQPRFVRIYPFAGVAALPEQVQRMQIEEGLFVRQNQARLRQLPFYRNTFGF